MPHAILQARNALKRLLRDKAQVPFQVIPDQPNLDLAPLPLYEAGRMSSEEEQGTFEKWLLSDIELCKDVAEFAAFAHALRGGAFAGADPVPRPSSTGAAAQPSPAASGQPVTTPALRSEASKGGGRVSPLVIAAIVFCVATLIVVAAYFLLR